jgi:hypothetical protein
MIGEEHGIAENPQLAAALFTALAPTGYQRLVVEVSPPMARALDTSAAEGLVGLERQFSTPGHEPAFFGMREEAAMLAAIRAVVPADQPAILGVDYEVGGDRLLLDRLADRDVPAAAAPALAELRTAATAAWAAYSETGDISKAFSFSGDPALVRAVLQSWPEPDTEARDLLEALETTLEINQLWVNRRGFDSNLKRAGYLRANFLRHWRELQTSSDPAPRMMVKLGASHVVRGRNSNEVYDIGTLAPELAAADGKSVFQLLVLPGKGSATAMLNPTTWTYESAEPKDNYMAGLEPLIAAAYPDTFTLIDLRPLRPILGYWRAGTNPDLMRYVHGFDMLLVMSGSTPASNLKTP